MRQLLIVPQFGLQADGTVVPGGLPAFGRSVARALASSPAIDRLELWSQVDRPDAEQVVTQMVQVYAHPQLKLEVRHFAGSKTKLAWGLMRANRRREYHSVMYLLVNQAALSLLPGHPPYSVWEIGVELSRPVSRLRRRALQRAVRLLSISNHTAETAARRNRGLPDAQVVHPCLEPPVFTLGPGETATAYHPAGREPAVLIVANMLRRYAYKGHRQLIAAWPAVTAVCPAAELWIAGDGDDRSVLEAEAQALPPQVFQQIHFLGRLDGPSLIDRYRRCRALAMPSTGEGFGLVFVEAARHGVPCVAGKHDGAKEIVLDGVTGLLVEQESWDIAAACLRLLTDDRLADRLGEAGRQRYQSHFRFEHFRERLLNALELDR